MSESKSKPNSFGTPELNAFFEGVTESIEALTKSVLALGQDIIKSNSDVKEQMATLNAAFVRAIAQQPQQQSVQRQQVTKSLPPTGTQFDPADLMNHEWKKGKRKPDGKYEKGSLLYGWDFANAFKDVTISELVIQGTLEIAGYEFTIDQNKKFVNTKKAK